MGANMRFWWVNQNQTYQAEVSGGYLWSPKTKADGARNPFYESMRQVQPGDIIFSFSKTLICAIGVVREPAQTSPKPSEFGSTGSYWSDEGWLVTVDFQEFTAPIRPKDQIDYLRPALPVKYSPLQHNGNGVQSIYLAEVPGPLAERVITLIGTAFDEALAELGANTRLADESANHQERQLLDRTDIGLTQIKQLVNARRGQGLFKTRVRAMERGCRVTGLDRTQHLIASHIKPWKESTDVEKLDGANGLLLSPHIDHLFDQGYISFSNIGELIVSASLRMRVLNAWHIDIDVNVGDFNPEQQKYLAFHREQVLRPAG